jgi:hypothetical protein
MPKPVEKNMSGSNLKTNSNTNSNYTNKKDSELYGVDTNNNYTNERLNEIKLQQEKKNSSIRNYFLVIFILIYWTFRLLSFYTVLLILFN